MSDFKPCPFCGGTRIVKGERYFAMCVDCGATGPERIGDKAGVKKLVADWNTKPESASEEATLLASLNQNFCLDCGFNGFLEGPSAGLMTNIECGQ